MPDLLLELRCEEIPARMQRKAAGDLEKLVTDALVEAGLSYEGARAYATPRRLALDVRGVPVRSADTREERRGPRTDAPQKAVDGFLRAAGLASVDEAQVRTDPKKGDFYVAVIEKPGRAAEDILAEALPGIIRGFPWPKSMRWGAASAKPGSLRWIRPLQSILCTFGPETEEPVVVDFEMGGLRSGNVTYGHRFHAPEPITVRRFADYIQKLEKAFVVLDSGRRKQIIEADARNLAFAAGLELVEDAALLDEVAGLVEWPVVLMGQFEGEYLSIPDAVARLTIKTNQKCFVTRKDGALANRFVLVANIEASDGGKEIAAGNARVVRARLADAAHFYKTDQADLPDLETLRGSAEKLGLDLVKPLDQRMARLDALDVTFHAKLGTQGDRVERIARLAGELAPVVGADPVKARRAALLAKADLQSEIVQEFPELQGAMGQHYAELQGEDESVAGAVEAHYRPQGPADAVPADRVAVAVALADKLDTLVGFWAIDEKPTGSKDPYALRRAALGVIRIVLENEVQLGLSTNMMVASLLHWSSDESRHRSDRANVTWPVVLQFSGEARSSEFFEKLHSAGDLILDDKEGMEARLLEVVQDSDSKRADLLAFFHDRLKVHLRDEGARHDLIDAVLASSGGGRTSPLVGEDVAERQGEQPSSRTPPSALPGTSPTSGEIAANDDLLLIVRRVEALGHFLSTDDGTNLLAGAKRAANILVAEAKKGALAGGAVDPALFQTDEERALFDSLEEAEHFAAQAIAAEDYEKALAFLSQLRQPIDAFFDEVLVNAEDEKLRANRLALLARIRAATGQVADFSRISGDREAA